MFWDGLSPSCDIVEYGSYVRFEWFTCLTDLTDGADIPFDSTIRPVFLDVRPRPQCLWVDPPSTCLV